MFAEFCAEEFSSHQYPPEKLSSARSYMLVCNMLVGLFAGTSEMTDELRTAVADFKKSLELHKDEYLIPDGVEPAQWIADRLADIEDEERRQLSLGAYCYGATLFSNTGMPFQTLLVSAWLKWCSI